MVKQDILTSEFKEFFQAYMRNGIFTEISIQSKEDIYRIESIIKNISSDDNGTPNGKKLLADKLKHTLINAALVNETELQKHLLIILCDIDDVCDPNFKEVLQGYDSELRAIQVFNKIGRV